MPTNSAQLVSARPRPPRMIRYKIKTSLSVTISKFIHQTQMVCSDVPGSKREGAGGHGNFPFAARVSRCSKMNNSSLCAFSTHENEREERIWTRTNENKDERGQTRTRTKDNQNLNENAAFSETVGNGVPKTLLNSSRRRFGPGWAAMADKQLATAAVCDETDAAPQSAMVAQRLQSYEPKMEGDGCSLERASRLPRAKRKRLSLRGGAVAEHGSSDEISEEIVDNARNGKGDLSKELQLVSYSKESTGADTERLKNLGCIIVTEGGDGRNSLLENSGNFEGQQVVRVLSSETEEGNVDKFWDAKEDLPFDMLEEVLSQYDKPVSLSNEIASPCEVFLDPQQTQQDCTSAGEPENSKCTAVESLNYRDHTYFEDYDVAEEAIEDFMRDGQPVSTEESFDDSLDFRDDLFFDEAGRDARRETFLDSQRKTGPELEGIPCEGTELSFKDSFYKDGTDWSALHEIDEYGLPYTSISPSSSDKKCPSKNGFRNVDCSSKDKVLEMQPAYQSQTNVLKPSLYCKEESKISHLPRSSRLKQGDLSSFLLFKPKPPADAKVKTEQRDIGTYFGLAPLAKQASAAANFLSKFRQPGRKTPVASSSDNTPRKGGNGWKMSRESTRGCPFYKKIPGTPFTVDAFKYGAVERCEAYFLTHFHSDHYGGLTRSWCHGPIFCTEITARLVSMHLGVDSRWLRPVRLDFLFMVEGVKVQFLEANHCPGAALILFQTSCGQRILHTGDFRACKSMQGYPDLLSGRITSLYLDTTYCNPKYNFPLQEDVIKHVVRLTTAALARNPKTLVTVGAYSIGKERVYLGIAKALNLSIYADNRRARTLRSLDWPDLTERLSSDASSSRLHVLPISHLNAAKLRAYMQSFHPTYSAVLAFRPTGWTYSEKVGSKLQDLKPQCSGAITVYGVPYSEHSSYSELREFVQFLRPEKIIATVNIGSAAQRESMQAHFNQWLKC